MTLVINLRRLRVQHDMTQAKLAQALGLSRQSIIHFEHQRFLPSLAVAYRLAELFDCSLDALLGRSNQVTVIEDGHKLTVEVALPINCQRQLIEVTMRDDILVVKIPKR